MKYTFQNKQFHNSTYSTKDNMTDLVEIITTPSEVSPPVQSAPNSPTTVPQNTTPANDTDQTVQGSDGKPITLNIRFLG